MERENIATIQTPNQPIIGKCMQVTKEVGWDYNICKIWERVLVEIPNVYPHWDNAIRLQHQHTSLTISTPQNQLLYSWGNIKLSHIAVPEINTHLILYFEFVGDKSGRVGIYNYKYGYYEV